MTCRLIAVASASAAATETPGFKRPMATIQRAWGILLRSLAAQNAMRSSQGRSLKPRGITPITVRGSPSTWKDVPITSFTPPRRRCQVSWEMTMERASFCLIRSSKSSGR